jgi:hypothetical protein
MIAHPCLPAMRRSADTAPRPAGARCGPARGRLAWPAQARVSDWLPYRPDQVRRLEPRLSGGMDHAAVSSRTLRIDPVITDEPAGARPAASPGKASATSATASGLQPPGAYVRIARQYGVDPWLLYGVALQESQLKFGARTLPYPGRCACAARACAMPAMAKLWPPSRPGPGVTNVDCGAMQVNWRWHADRLGSFERALDPYPNLSVGAQILRDTDAWRLARCHCAVSHGFRRHGRSAPAANAMPRRPARLERLGVRHAAAIAGGPWLSPRTSSASWWQAWPACCACPCRCWPAPAIQASRCRKSTPALPFPWRPI